MCDAGGADGFGKCGPRPNTSQSTKKLFLFAASYVVAQGGSASLGFPQDVDDVAILHAELRWRPLRHNALAIEEELH
jgi:hypothetical protein